MSECEIRVPRNTIPVVYGKREEAERGVRDGIGERAGVWTLTLDEPPNESRWEVGIESPDGQNRHFTFDGPDELTADFVRSTVDKTLP